MTEMTKREFFEAVIEAVEDAELKLFAEKEIAKMDERNAKRKASPSKKSVENEPIKEAIRNVIGADPLTASEIAETVGISTQKASALLRQMDGLTVTEMKVKGKGKVKGYALA
jgi:predicted XRE-type DNA-binding protein